MINKIVAFGGLAALGFFACSGGKRASKETWEQSESPSDLTRLDQYLRERNAAALDALGKELRARQASRTGENAVVLSIFDGLIATRADLAENRVSTDVQNRIGEELVATWEGRLREQSHDGAQLLVLDKLQPEISREEVVASSLEQSIQKFSEALPTFRKGDMKPQRDLAVSELAGFRQDEIGREQALWNSSHGAIRNRAHSRLLAGSPDYRTMTERGARFSALNSTLVQPALKAAQEIDQSLALIIQYRREELRLRIKAEGHPVEEVPDTCYRNEPVVEDTEDGGEVLHDPGNGRRRGSGVEDTEDGGEVLHDNRRGNPEVEDMDDGGEVLPQTDSKRRQGVEDTEDGGEILHQGMVPSLATPGSGTHRVPYPCTKRIDISDRIRKEADQYAGLANGVTLRALEARVELQYLLGQLNQNPTVLAEGLGAHLPRGESRWGQRGRERVILFYNPFFRSLEEVLLFDRWTTNAAAEKFEDAVLQKGNFAAILTALERLTQVSVSRESELSGQRERLVDADLVRLREEARIKPQTP